MSAVDRFIEELGLFSQEQGNSRIAGSIVGLLIAEGRELSLNEISERLAVSRASVSTNARQLARKGVIQLRAHAGDRQDYYEITDLPYAEMLGELAQQFERHARTVGTCIDGMRDEDAAAADRAAVFHNFLERSATILNDWADTLGKEAARPKDDR
jgi:DNA-binding transcriptional regulator GbsR (MarR family)